MTIYEGWLSGCIIEVGVPDKVYSEPNKGLGFALHSIEGSIAGALSRFMSTDKLADGRYTPNAEASCMFLNPNVGLPFQMYPITASTWTSGSRLANTTLWAVESEGKAGEPLSINQVANMMYLIDEWETHTGKKAVRVTADIKTRTIWEHREVSTAHTFCPSGRYAPFYAALALRKEEVRKEMTPDEKEFLKWAPARLSALEHALTGLTGNDAIVALAALNALGAKPLAARIDSLERDGDKVLRNTVAGHIIHHPAQGGERGHTHETGKAVYK